MKVSTDACIQGAWAADQLRFLSADSPAILDIGTGTGLLTLMMVQALPEAFYDAVEINEDAYQQAKANFNASEWYYQLNALRVSLADFASNSNYHRYDFIICNPPFFQNHLESSVKARNDARHSQSLSKPDLAESISKLIKIDGQFCVIFPATEWENWLNIAEKAGLFLQTSLSIKPKPSHNPNRIIGIFKKQKTNIISRNELIIYLEDKQYSIEMKELLKPYYLAF